MTALPKKRTRASRRRMGYGQRNYWWEVCWWEDNGRGFAYAKNDELIDELNNAAPPVVDGKRSGLGKYTITLPSGKQTNLLPDMAFSNKQFLLAIIDAWHDVWVTVRPDTPSRAQKRAAAAAERVAAGAVDPKEGAVDSSASNRGSENKEVAALRAELEESKAENAKFKARFAALEARVESGGVALANGTN